MVEFVQSYGLWIALAGVFVAMHWFGMGCCGGRRRENSAEPSERAAGKSPGSENVSEASPKARGSCH
jgi:hypothetical protein